MSSSDNPRPKDPFPDPTPDPSAGRSSRRRSDSGSVPGATRSAHRDWHRGAAAEARSARALGSVRARDSALGTRSAGSRLTFGESNAVRDPQTPGGAGQMTWRDHPTGTVRSSAAGPSLEIAFDAERRIRRKRPSSAFARSCGCGASRRSRALWRTLTRCMVVVSHGDRSQEGEPAGVVACRRW